jgi:hypothetical protein
MWPGQSIQIMIMIIIYLTAIGLTPSGSSTHLHTNNTQNNTVRQNTQNGTYITIKILKLTKEHIT